MALLQKFHPKEVTWVPSLDETVDYVREACILGTPVTIPRPRSRERIFLHVYSGRRRPGDFQFYPEHFFAQDAEGLVLHVVSLDIVIDETWGDVRNPATQDFWLRHAREGRVHAALCGPPCETWSEARFVRCAQKGPRPLRALLDLWGLQSLALKKELFQVAVGNDLLLFALHLMVCLAISGGFGVVEHPAEPAAPERPSIWRLEALPNFNSFTLAQGLLGAMAPKPTKLLVLNMPDLPEYIVKNRLCSDPPKRSAIGLNELGQWATQLKEYLPAFNRALAQCFSFHIRQWSTDSSIHADDEFLARCVSMQATHFTLRIGKDFSG